MAGKQEAVVRSFLRKISPNRDWDYLGEHEHALISDLVNDIAAMHGTLTAEQVREAIESRFDFDVWVPNERWQAIADELNAELGSGTCELREATWDDGQCTWGVVCSACGARHEHTHGYGWNFAPCCGKAVDE